MIQRIYIENFRCFEKLDINFRDRKSVLVSGKNGAGKSTLVSVFRFLQSIGLGSNRVSELVKFTDRRSDLPMRVEISVSLDSRLFCYQLEIVPRLLFPAVIEESLSVDGRSLFTRASVEIDMKILALPTIGAPTVVGTIQEKLTSLFAIKTFREWMGRMVILAPVPSSMTGVSSDLVLTPTDNGENFASWLNGLLNQFPKTYEVITSFVSDLLPDYLDFEKRLIGEATSDIFVKFGSNGKSKSIAFTSLSDGEKCFFLCGAVVAANQVNGPIVCLWDEPDNFLSPSEVGHFIMALRRSFEAKGQLIVTSHNLEAIRKFSDENTLYLNRRSHLDPPTARWLSDLHYTGDLVESLI
jgi:predicted ATPase